MYLWGLYCFVVNIEFELEIASQYKKYMLWSQTLKSQIIIPINNFLFVNLKWALV